MANKPSENVYRVFSIANTEVPVKEFKYLKVANRWVDKQDDSDEYIVVPESLVKSEQTVATDVDSVLASSEPGEVVTVPGGVFFAPLDTVPAEAVWSDDGGIWTADTEDS